jgi:hypothetical protein
MLALSIMALTGMLLKSKLSKLRNVPGEPEKV